MVRHQPSKLTFAGPNPVSRSLSEDPENRVFFVLIAKPFAGPIEGWHSNPVSRSSTKMPRSDGAFVFPHCHLQALSKGGIRIPSPDFKKGVPALTRQGLLLNPKPKTYTLKPISLNQPLHQPRQIFRQVHIRRDFQQSMRPGRKPGAGSGAAHHHLGC